MVPPAPNACDPCRVNRTPILETACWSQAAEVLRAVDHRRVLTTRTRADQAAPLERWADAVEPEDLRIANTNALRAIAELVDQRHHVDTELTRAVRSARSAHRSWSEIGAMLGVSKQAAQRKYGDKASG